MQNFTKAHLDTVVSYANKQYDVISISLKEAVEKVSAALGEEKEFFTDKEVSGSVRNKEQLKLELALRFVALNDQDAMAELMVLFKSKAEGLKYRSTDSNYNEDEFYGFLFECLESLQWVAALNKGLRVDNIIHVQVKGRMIRHFQKEKVGSSGSDKDVEILNALKKHFDGEVHLVVMMTFEEFQKLYPERSIRGYYNIMSLASREFDKSLETYIEETIGKDDKCEELCASKNETEELIAEGTRGTFVEAIRYTEDVVERALKEKRPDTAYANKFRAINIGYRIYLAIYINGYTKEEATAYYSKYYSKAWEKHEADYFINKAMEDFKENYDFYSHGDEEVASMIKYLIKANGKKTA